MFDSFNVSFQNGELINQQVFVLTDMLLDSWLISMFFFFLDDRGSLDYLFHNLLWAFRAGLEGGRMGTVFQVWNIPKSKWIFFLIEHTFRKIGYIISVWILVTELLIDTQAFQYFQYLLSFRLEGKKKIQPLNHWKRGHQNHHSVAFNSFHWAITLESNAWQLWIMFC